ncbi:MAG: hypothetical protein ACAI18_19630 [Gemmatimonadales bacterium]
MGEPVSGGSADEAPVPLPAPAGAPEVLDAPRRKHLVVVTTRALAKGESPTTGALIRTKFWHPRDHQWSENDFESLEHAKRLFIEESGWVLRQEQSLAAPLAFELIFEAHRVDFTRPSQDDILREVGLTPEGVNRLMQQVDRGRRAQEGEET